MSAVAQLRMRDSTQIKPRVKKTFIVAIGSHLSPAKTSTDALQRGDSAPNSTKFIVNDVTGCCAKERIHVRFGTGRARWI
jgi:hypothetical protein